jgi:hypothetical protein
MIGTALEAMAATGRYMLDSCRDATEIQAMLNDGSENGFELVSMGWDKQSKCWLFIWDREPR